MKVSEIGQFPLINKISQLIDDCKDNSVSWQNTIEAAGDDCAVWLGEDVKYFGKVDCQVESVHFNLDVISWQDLGRKALAVNLSDIASMGGLPRYAMVSLGLPLDTEVDDVMSLYGGILELAKETGTAVVGGNISRSLVIFIDISLIGAAGNPAGNYLSRSSAKAGDLIAVTGSLGSAAAGLRLLTGRDQTENTQYDSLMQAFLRPEPRLKEGILLEKMGVKAAIDISDGLLADLDHICSASKAGAKVYLKELPVLPALRNAFPENYYEMALAGGEDYQLLFTAPEPIINKVIENCDYPVSVIGEITEQSEERIQLFDESGRIIKTDKLGWDHLKSR
jgi:thiamine-monophosphate kinase